MYHPLHPYIQESHTGRVVRESLIKWTWTPSHLVTPPWGKRYWKPTESVEKTALPNETPSSMNVDTFSDWRSTWLIERLASTSEDNIEKIWVGERVPTRCVTCSCRNIGLGPIKKEVRSRGFWSVVQGWCGWSWKQRGNTVTGTRRTGGCLDLERW